MRSAGHPKSWFTLSSKLQAGLLPRLSHKILEQMDRILATWIYFRLILELALQRDTFSKHSFVTRAPLLALANLLERARSEFAGRC